MAIDTPEETIALKCPSSAGDLRIPDFILAAEFYISSKTFGVKTGYAQGLLICHWFVLEARAGGNESTSGSGGTGSVVEKKEGDLQLKFADSSSMFSAGNQYLAGSTHGQELLMLFNACIILPRNRYV